MHFEDSHFPNLNVQMWARVLLYMRSRMAKQESYVLLPYMGPAQYCIWWLRSTPKARWAQCRVLLRSSFLGKGLAISLFCRSTFFLQDENLLLCTYFSYWWCNTLIHLLFFCFLGSLYVIMLNMWKIFIFWKMNCGYIDF